MNMINTKIFKLMDYIARLWFKELFIFPNGMLILLLWLLITPVFLERIYIGGVLVIFLITMFFRCIIGVSDFYNPKKKE